MVSTPPSCLRPPPDPPPPPSFFWLMQHYSSSLKMMVTALPPPSQPGPPPDPSPNKHFPVETLSPVKPPEPADPPDVSVSFVLLRIFVTFSDLLHKLLKSYIRCGCQVNRALVGNVLDGLNVLRIHIHVSWWFALCYRVVFAYLVPSTLL
ncbi:hypothetical protein Bca4012_096179 [Brassica carinata]